MFRILVVSILLFILVLISGCGRMVYDNMETIKVCKFVCAPIPGRMIDNECLCRNRVGWVYPVEALTGKLTEKVPSDDTSK